MRKIIFDIETRNTFQEAGSADPAALDISVVCLYDSLTNDYLSFLQEDFGKLWPIIEKADLLIGFNSDHFDIPLLNKYYPGDLTTIRSLDILKEVRASIGRRVKLDSIAEGTLGKKKSGHGLEAITWWRNGEIDKIKKYCIDDVKITKEVYEYALKNKELKFKEGGKVNVFKVDTSKWDAAPEAKLTHTLPF
jgi:DEAD/DEAH box helicase domain-containing protein